MHVGSPANDRGRWRGYLHLLRSGHGRCRRPHPSSRVTVRQNSSICRQVRRSARSACPVPCPARTSAWRTRASGTAGPGFSARERRHREADKKRAVRLPHRQGKGGGGGKPSEPLRIPAGRPPPAAPALPRRIRPLPRAAGLGVSPSRASGAIAASASTIRRTAPRERNSRKATEIGAAVRIGDGRRDVGKRISISSAAPSAIRPPARR